MAVAGMKPCARSIWQFTSQNLPWTWYFQQRLNPMVFIPCQLNHWVWYKIKKPTSHLLTSPEMWFFTHKKGEWGHYNNWYTEGENPPRNGFSVQPPYFSTPAHWINSMFVGDPTDQGRGTCCGIMHGIRLTGFSPASVSHHSTGLCKLTFLGTFMTQLYGFSEWLLKLFLINTQ